MPQIYDLLKKIEKRDGNTTMEEKLFYVGLFAICDALRGHVTGTSDPLATKDADLFCRYLIQRRENWSWHSKKNNWYSKYDRAVYNLVEATIDGYSEWRLTHE